MKYFSLLAGVRRVGSLPLTTYKNNHTCDGWVHPGKVTFNGAAIAPNTQGQYVLVAQQQ